MTRDELEAAGVRLSSIPMPRQARYTLAAGGQIVPGANFGSRREVDDWVSMHHGDLDWRAGYVFRLKGLPIDLSIQDAKGVRLRP